MKSLNDKTQAVHLASDPQAQDGVVNPPISRGSTVLFPTLEALESSSSHPFEGTYYGRFGTNTQFAFEEAMTALEGGAGAVTTSCGLSAVALAFFSQVSAGDHVLVADSVYGPTRKFCDGVLQRFSVAVEYYDPLIGGEIASLIRSNTRLIFLESPGSLLFEMQDIQAITAAAREAKVVTAIDSTWGTPIHFKPLSLGLNISVHAATKYIVGHSDVLLGSIVCDELTFERVRIERTRHGHHVSADDCSLGLRGLRTLPTRLAQHESSAIQVANWMSDRDEVARVICPMLPTDPGYANWQRDFQGGCGLFAVQLKAVSQEKLASMLDGLALFGMGYSWGGFESLVLPNRPTETRTVTTVDESGPYLRLHIGLESVEDLVDDLAAGFARMK